MAFTTATPFPFAMTPMANISAPTYRDAATYTLELETIKNWLNTVLVPEFNDGIANAIAEYQNAILNAEMTVTDAKTAWDARFDAFIADIVTELEALNDTAVANLVGNALSGTGAALRTLIDTMSVAPDELDTAAALAVTDTASELFTAITALVDARNDATRDDATAALFGTATDTRAAVDTRVTSLLGTDTPARTALDARVAATGDALVSGLAGDPYTATAAAVHTAVTNAPARSSGNRHTNIGQVRVPVTTARYSAFPSVTTLRDGRLFAVWYEATNHEAARDGIIVGAYSADRGVTWTPKTTVHTEPGIDLRDPSVSTSTDGLTVYLTYTKATAAEPRNGFFLKTSTNQGATFGPAVQIDVPGSNGFGCSPVIELANGSLFATWYGREDGDAYDSCFFATSVDGGATWGGRTEFRDGVTDGRSYNEPCAAVDGNNIVIMYRWGNEDGIGIIRSGNSGATWGTPVRVFTGSGRPQPVITDAGTVIVVYRLGGFTPVSAHGMMRTSPDLGVTWTRERRVEEAAGGWWIYSGLTEVAPGQVLCLSAIETSSTTTQISGRYLTEGGGHSPFGDVPPTAYDRALSRTSSIAAVDTFDRADSPTLGRTDDGMVWVSTANNVHVLDGSLQNLTGGTVSTHVVNIRTPNNEISAELAWTDMSGVALVFRYVDANNYFFVTTEISGTVLRLYKKVDGVDTQLETANINFMEGLFYRVRVSNINTVIRVYFEDDLIFNSIQGLQTGFWAGVKVGVSTSPNAIHKVRNLVIHRRAGYAS